MKSKRYSDKKRYENLLNVWTFYGRQAKNAEMKNLPSTVGPKAYITRWGSWTNALHAFVDQVNQDIGDFEKNEEPAGNQLKTEKPKKIPEEERREIKLVLRYKILSRDNFKCKKCGDSPALKHGCRLHIDHIVPFSKGGKTTLENLQTLCEKCNIGKRNRFYE